jgi:hypothetical protein
MSAPNQNQPGLVASHAQYVKGAAEVRTCFQFSLHKAKFCLQNSFCQYCAKNAYSHITGNYRQRHRQ